MIRFAYSFAMKRKYSESVIAFNNEVKSSLLCLLDDREYLAEEIHFNLESLVEPDVWIPSVPSIYDYMRLFENIGIVKSDNSDKLNREKRGKNHRAQKISKTKFRKVDDSLRKPAEFSILYSAMNSFSLYSFFGTRNVSENGSAKVRTDILNYLYSVDRSGIVKISEQVGKQCGNTSRNLDSLVKLGFVKKLGEKMQREAYRVTREFSEEVYDNFLSETHKALKELFVLGKLHNPITIKEAFNIVKSKGYNVKISSIKDKLYQAYKEGYLKKEKVCNTNQYSIKGDFMSFIESGFYSDNYRKLLELSFEEMYPGGDFEEFTCSDLTDELESKSVARGQIDKLKELGILETVDLGYQLSGKGRKFVNGYLIPMQSFFDDSKKISNEINDMFFSNNYTRSIMISEALRQYSYVAPFNKSVALCDKKKDVISYINSNGPSRRANLIEDLTLGDSGQVFSALKKEGVIGSYKDKGKAVYYLLEE